MPRHSFLRHRHMITNSAHSYVAALQPISIVSERAPGPAGGPGQHELMAAGFCGDCTALAVVPLQFALAADSSQPLGSDDGGTASAAAAAPAAATQLLLAGMGSQLHAYALPSGVLACCTTVLPDAVRVHGISWLPASPTPDGRPQLLAAVHGGRRAALLRLLGPAHGCSPASGWSIQQVALLPPFQHWTLDAQLTRADSSDGSADSLLLAVGLSSNAVAAFSLQVQASGKCRVRQVMAAECSGRCLLYSLALLPQPAAAPPVVEQQQLACQRQRQPCGEQPLRVGSSACSWLVAAGTILLDVLVWRTPGAASGCPGGSPLPPAVVAQPLLLLKGHEGSIHR